MPGSSTSSEVRWLTPDEMAAWRGLQRMNAYLTGRLSSELPAEGEVSILDYPVLVLLSEHPEGRLRAFELGRELGWEKSRLSHHVARMVQKGLVERQKCPSDMRGLFIAITPRGRKALEAAAPGHVEAVRRSFIDLLTPEQLATVAQISRTVVDALHEECRGAIEG